MREIIPMIIYFLLQKNARFENVNQRVKINRGDYNVCGQSLSRPNWINQGLKFLYVFNSIVKRHSEEGISGRENVFINLIHYAVNRTCFYAVLTGRILHF